MFLLFAPVGCSIYQCLYLRCLSLKPGPYRSQNNRKEIDYRLDIASVSRNTVPFACSKRKELVQDCTQPSIDKRDLKNLPLKVSLRAQLNHSALITHWVVFLQIKYILNRISVGVVWSGYTLLASAWSKTNQRLGCAIFHSSSTVL